MELEYITLDVFTSTAYEGNPLAIVKVPRTLQAFLSREQKLKIAKEFNLSETVFLYEAHETAKEHIIDIFTWDREIPFAGHPTIGTAFYLLNVGRPDYSRSRCQTLITKAGPIEVSLSPKSEGGCSAIIPHDVHIHSRKLEDSTYMSDDEDLAQAEREGEFVSIVKGMTFLLVKLPNLAALARVKYSGKSLPPELLDEGWNEGFVAKYYWVFVGNGPDATGTQRLRTRMLEGTMEDPATGSAASALACYLSLTGRLLSNSMTTDEIEITQGVEMGRKSIIGVRVELEEDEDEVNEVELRGTAVQIMAGKLRV